MYCEIVTQKGQPLEGECTLDLSIVGLNPICDTVLRMFFLLEYTNLESVESSGKSTCST